MRVRSILSLAAAIALSACTTYGDPGYAAGDPPPVLAEESEDRYGDYAYDGQDFDRGGGHGDFEGPGAEVLDPWLAETREGWFIVTRGFGDAAQGFVSDEVAVRANLWFRRYADADRDMRLTDEEIRRALAWAVAARQDQGG